MSPLSQSELEARERWVDEAPTDNFAELIHIAGLDPKKHLRFADWSGVDFSGCDLRDFDFTGARLIGCNFKGARIEGARFDQALIDVVRPGAKLDPDRTNLWAAGDWERYARGWKKPQKRTPEHLPPGTVFQDAPIAPEMVVIPPGRFMMGSKDGEGRADERPRHRVTIPNALAVGRFPVTFDEWGGAHAAGGVKNKPSDEGRGRGQRPVVNVSWQDSQTYVSWLSRVTGKPYRLLSEAEWEYACRAGTDTTYSFDARAPFPRGRSVGWSATFEVGRFPGNNFGLYDMHGNVSEWCEDCRHESYADKPKSVKQTGAAWITTDVNVRILRGGSPYSYPEYLRSALRNWNPAEIREDGIGFRVARTILT